MLECKYKLTLQNLRFEMDGRGVSYTLIKVLIFMNVIHTGSSRVAACRATRKTAVWCWSVLIKWSLTEGCPIAVGYAMHF